MAAASFAWFLLLHIFFVFFSTVCSYSEANSSCNGTQTGSAFKLHKVHHLHCNCKGHFPVECGSDDGREVLRIQLSDDDCYTTQNISCHTLAIQDGQPSPNSGEEDHLCNFTEPIDKSHPHANPNFPEERGPHCRCNKHDDYGICDAFPQGPCTLAVNCTVIFANASESHRRGHRNYSCATHDEAFIFDWTLSFNESGLLFQPSACAPYRSTMLPVDCFKQNATGESICINKRSHGTAIMIGVGVGGGFIILATLIGLLLLYRHRQTNLRSSTILLSRTGSIDPSFSKDDTELGTYPEMGVSCHRTNVFTFEELHEATGGFNESNELGDGGFGIVYKGVLRDGRVVAVKRLYQQNCRRLEQFMNEVDIVSDLKHPNLVMLYGCTSRRSRDLLLVYEYVPNGTVADHLYGVQADAGFLMWRTRMSIAVETADALAYLHDDGTQIIHRDVKTSNILLDDHFHVKVADFGLSRLFPTDVTHVSTAPQGTPGYLDPEYHQCYQLTDKSDVYSFGVVLAELISSKPAVDVTRQRSEINLSNMAMNKILSQEMDQFVDLRLGYQSDTETRKMIDSVAELAFRCLQLERDMRPTMKEVLGVLRSIRSRGPGAETRGMEPDVEAKEDAHLLKNAPLYSPNSVTERWASVATTSNANG